MRNCERGHANVCLVTRERDESTAIFTLRPYTLSLFPPFAGRPIPASLFLIPDL